MWGKCELLVLAHRNLYAQEGLCLHAPRHTTLRTCVYVSTKLVGPEHVVCPLGLITVYRPLRVNTRQILF